MIRTATIAEAATARSLRSASFLDVRMRWREAHQFMGYGDGEDNVRAIR